MLIPKELPSTFVCSTDQSRGSIQGVRLEREGSNCRAITTDGHRLALLSWQDPTAELAEGLAVTNSEAERSVNTTRTDGPRPPEPAAVADQCTHIDPDTEVRCGRWCPLYLVPASPGAGTPEVIYGHCDRHGTFTAI